jgi:SAM-dependent methyltransferase
VSDHDWNQHYLDEFTPWDTDTPAPELVEFVRGRDRAPGRALDIGCGTGTHALWLADQGFDVLGIDIARRAIERARARAAAARPDGRIRFEVLDVLTSLPEGGPFDLVFDRGVFHVFDSPEDRTRFAAQVARCLAPSGAWLSLIGSTEGPPREEGPPRRSARDIVNAIEPALEIVELRTSAFDLDRPVPPRAWCCVARRRDVPAQPSTSA